MTPRVRVVVLNHNGGALTLDCLRRLAKTDWPAAALELVLVDNASTDEVVERVRDELPEVRVIVSPINLGFAGGCNLALRDLDDVDHVALVNNDLLVEPDWLRPLASSLDADPGLGATCPKILLASPMVDVTVRVASTIRRGRGDRRQLGARLSGVRVDGEDRTALTRFVDGFWGPEHGAGDEPDCQWTAREALLRVPVSAGVDAASCELRLSADGPVEVEVVSGAAATTYTVGREPAWYPGRLDGEPGDVINNVGSELTADWYGADRGYLERDNGQYDTAEDVEAWCGAAVLLRRSHLDDVGLFDERLFLYYEDLELSLRGAERGWRYQYVPESVVRHVHSATSVEGSALADHYNARNRLLVLARHAPRRVLIRAIARYLLVTASYASRDVVSPWLRGAPVRWESIRRRLHALASFFPRAPAMIFDRDPPRRRAAKARSRPRRAVRMTRLTAARLLASQFPFLGGHRLAPPFVGRVERPDDAKVVGHTGRVCWVAGWVLSTAGRPVRVQARVNGTLVIDTTADEPRPDVVDRLAPWLTVNPLCGFAFYADLPPLGGEQGALTVEFSDGEKVSRRQRFTIAPEPELMRLETYEGMSRAKRELARRHLRGRGVELGALHNPLPCDKSRCTVSYVDRLTREQALATFPELDEHADKIVDPDFIVDLATENLSALRPHGFDFFIANDVIEHLPNPLKLLRDVYDVMKPGALLFLSAPDRDFTFDVRRRLTTRRHLWREYKRGTTIPSPAHLRDYARGIAPEVLSWSPADRENYFEAQRSRSYHVHVWNQASFDEFLDWATRRLDLHWQIVDRAQSRDARGSMAYVLRRDDS